MEAGLMVPSTKWSPIPALCMLGVIAGILLFIGRFVWRTHEPIYDGKSVTDWIEHLDDRKLQGKAVHSLKALGSDAVPYLRETLRKKGSSWSDYYRSVWLLSPAWFKNLTPFPRDPRIVRRIYCAAVARRNWSPGTRSHSRPHLDHANQRRPPYPHNDRPSFGKPCSSNRPGGARNGRTEAGKKGSWRNIFGRDHRLEPFKNRRSERVDP